MSLRRFTVVAFSVTGALLLAILLYLAFGDLGRHKGRIEALVTELTGRPFAIDGSFEVAVLPSIRVRAERVRLGNAPGARRRRWSRSGAFRLRSASGPCFSGRQTSARSI